MIFSPIKLSFKEPVSQFYVHLSILKPFNIYSGFHVCTLSNHELQWNLLKLFTAKFKIFWRENQHYPSTKRLQSIVIVIKISPRNYFSGIIMIISTAKRL